MVSDRIFNSRFVLLLAIGGYAVTLGCDSAAQNQRTAQPPPPGVVVTQVEATDVPVMSEYPAQTYSRNTVEVRGRVDGYIDKWGNRIIFPAIPFDTGDADTDNPDTPNTGNDNGGQSPEITVQIRKL